ncbi:MAG: hypothetical protein ACYTE5_01915, partial [Planctomycetota bacterium]|jgi:hypothetical protein
MFSLAALYMKDERFDQSRKILLDVLSLDPSNQDAADLLEEVEHSLAKTRQVTAFESKSQNGTTAGAGVG